MTQSTTVNYYQFIPCCQGQPDLFFAGDSTLVDPGAYEYEGRCYTVVYIFAPYPGILPLVPDQSELSPIGDCNNAKCNCCQCIRIRFKVGPGGPPVAIPAIDCNDQVIGITIPTDGTWSEKTCVQSWEANPDIYEIDISGDCIEDTEPTIPLWECPIETCFLLEDCEGVQDDVYVTYESLANYFTRAGKEESLQNSSPLSPSATVIIDGFPGTCWTFREVSTCECTIEATVLSNWESCEECTKCKGYKLTNCEDDAYIKYTTNDLSDYVGKVVEFENCPGCWLVTCLEEYPPNDQDLTPLYEFNTCEDCLSTFWKLTPCVETAGPDPIFTDTDLSAYEGFIITLDGIDGVCWELEEVRDLEGTDFETVFINTYYETCIDCTVDILPCQCSSAVNSFPFPVPLRYLDCNGEWQETDPIGPNIRSPKVCVAQWRTGIPADTPEVDIEYYGDCTENNEDPTVAPLWECPVLAPRLRSVRPGYDTPGCPADYFDKISCKFAEALYKDVLADRYGIVTNCSDKESRKWEIKKELLNLAAITDPDYDCPPITGCYDPCRPVSGFIDCSVLCHQYTVTIPANSEDQDIVYTACETRQETTINYTTTNVDYAFDICIAGGTPITTQDGIITYVDICTQDIPSPPPPVPLCRQFDILIPAFTPGNIIEYVDCTNGQGVKRKVGFLNAPQNFTVCVFDPASISTVGIITEIGLCS
jgi:hypothetical protein